MARDWLSFCLQLHHFYSSMKSLLSNLAYFLCNKRNISMLAIHLTWRQSKQIKYILGLFTRKVDQSLNYIPIMKESGEWPGDKVTSALTFYLTLYFLLAVPQARRKLGKETWFFRVWNSLGETMALKRHWICEHTFFLFLELGQEISSLSLVYFVTFNTNGQWSFVSCSSLTLSTN